MILALWPPTLQCQLPALLFVSVVFIFCLLFVVVFLEHHSRTKGEGWSITNKCKPPSDFIAGRPKVALLFWFFDGFGCGVPLFIVIRAIYKYENT